MRMKEEDYLEDILDYLQLENRSHALTIQEIEKILIILIRDALERNEIQE